MMKFWLFVLQNAPKNPPSGRILTGKRRHCRLPGSVFQIRIFP